MDNKDNCIDKGTIEKLASDLLKLSQSVISINDSVKKLDEKLESLTKVDVINGNGIPAIASLPTAVKILIDSVVKVNDKVIELDKKVEITPDKLVNVVEENIDVIIDIADNYRKETNNEKIKNTNDKLKFVEYLVFFALTLFNILIVIYGKK